MAAFLFLKWTKMEVVYRSKHMKRDISGIELEASADTDKMRIKTALAAQIASGVKRLGLTQEEAAKRMGLPQPKVSAVLRGEVGNVSERKLMDCLTGLGYDIEIQVRPGSRQRGHLMLAVA